MLYDPFTYDTLMAGMVLRFEQQPLHPLGGEVNIEGPGVYCLLYQGDYELYRPISGSDNPIYAGKAVPPGSRRGDDGDTQVPVLRRRIREHARSIDAANNLNLSDFSYRALAVVPAWINIAERSIIQHYGPVWNRCLDGFGDHDPGRGRQGGEKSWWDTLHPGRTWANRLVENKTVSDASAMVVRFFASEEDALFTGSEASQLPFTLTDEPPVESEV